MLPRVEVGELIHTVQDIGHQLFQEDPRCDADFAAQFAGDGLGQIPNVAVVAARSNPIGSLGVLLKDVADLAPDLAEPFEVESGQADLRGAGIVEPGVGLEIDVQPLSQ